MLKVVFNILDPPKDEQERQMTKIACDLKSFF